MSDADSRSNSGGSSEECHNCGETHTDWSKDGTHAINDGHSEGMMGRWECGRCGAITEVPRY